MSSSPVSQQLNHISSLTSKMLRKNFGRGPDSCHAFANGSFLIFYIRGFLSPMESVLLDNGNSDQIDVSRSIVMKSAYKELRGVLEIEFDTEIKYFYHDWNYIQNSGMIAIEFESEIMSKKEKRVEAPIDYKHLIYEVEHISILVQKKPEKTEAFFISPKMILVKREGILVQIEKALIKKGYEQTLMVVKDELEKSYLHGNGHFNDIFRKPVVDIFVDWDFCHDNSIICFVLGNGHAEAEGSND